MSYRADAYMRAGTHWHQTILDGKRVLWIGGTEGTGMRVCSIHDPERDAPAERRVAPCGCGRACGHPRPGVELLAGEPRGLIVYGTHKWDRPTFDSFAAADPEYGYLVEGIMEGRGITDGAAGRHPSTSAQVEGGRKGGRTTGVSKRRGNAAHYRALAQRSAAARRSNRDRAK